MTPTNQPVTYVRDCNVQLYVLYHIPDNFQDVAGIVLDYLQISSRVWTLLQVHPKNSINFFECKQRGTSKSQAQRLKYQRSWKFSMTTRKCSSLKFCLTNEQKSSFAKRYTVETHTLQYQRNTFTCLAQMQMQRQL